MKVHTFRKRDGTLSYQIDAKRFDDTYPQGFFSDDLDKAPMEAERYLKPDLARDAIRGIEMARRAQLGKSPANMRSIKKAFRFH